MRTADETDVVYWTRREREVRALAEKLDGEIRQAHLNLAESYAKLIALTEAAETELGG